MGYGSHGLGAPTDGPAIASAAGFALAALAVLPVVTGRDILRIGIGLCLLLSGALLVRVGLGRDARRPRRAADRRARGDLGGAVAILAVAARADGTDGF